MTFPVLNVFFLMGAFLGTSSFSLAPAESAPGETAQRILERECLTCHGQVAISGLDLRNRESMLTGGQQGPALVPGNAEESLLFLAASHSGELKMPPKKPPLPTEDLEALREWIDAGAPWGGLVTEPHSLHATRIVDIRMEDNLIHFATSSRIASLNGVRCRVESIIGHRAHWGQSPGSHEWLVTCAIYPIWPAPFLKFSLIFSTEFQIDPIEHFENYE